MSPSVKRRKVSARLRLITLRQTLQRLEFRVGQITPLSRLKIPQFERSHGHSLQSLDRKSKSCQHSTYLTIATFPEDESQVGPASVSSKDLQLFSGSPSCGVPSVRKEDASPQPVEIGFLDMAPDTDFIGPCHFMGWMGQSLGKFAVIGQKQQA